MMTLVAKITAADGKADELEAALRTMVSAVSATEKGPLVNYTLHKSDTEPGVFVLYEQYRDADAFGAHGKTTHMEALRTALGTLTGGRPTVERLTEIARI